MSENPVSLFLDAPADPKRFMLDTPLLDPIIENREAFERSTRGMEEEERESAQTLFDAGLIDGELHPTKRGLTFNKAVQDAGEDFDAALVNLGKGFITPDLRPTEDGVLFMSPREDVIGQGTERDKKRYQRWKAIGGHAEWKKATGQDFDSYESFIFSAIENAPESAKHLALTILPDAAGFGFELWKRGAQETWGRILNWKPDQEDKDRFKVMMGEFSREAMRNAAIMSDGSRLAIMYHPWFKHLFDDEHRFDAEWDYVRHQQELENLTTSEALAGGIATLDTLAGVAEFVPERPREVREAAEEAEQRLLETEGGVRKVVRAKAVGRGGGEILGDPSMLVTAGFGGFGRLGTAPVKRLAQAERVMMGLQARKALLETTERTWKGLAKRGDLPLGPNWKPELSALRRQIADVDRAINSQTLRMKALTDRIADGAFPRMRALGRKARGAPIVGAGKITGGVGRGLVAVNDKMGHVFDWLFPAAGYVGGGLPGAAAGMVARGPSLVRLGGILDKLGHAFMQRRGRYSVFRRAANSLKDNPVAKSALLGVDLVTKPVQLAGKLAPVVGRSIAAEVPFSYLAAGGSSGVGGNWLEDAIAEGTVMGLAGKGANLISGKAFGLEIEADRNDHMAAQLAMAQEVRGAMSDPRQRAYWDRSPSELKRMVGVMQDAYPDMVVNFDPDARRHSWDEDLQILTIKPDSTLPLAEAFMHEVKHFLDDQGMTRTVEETLRPALLDEDGSPRAFFQQFIDRHNELDPDNARDPGNADDLSYLIMEYGAESGVAGLKSAILSGDLERQMARHPLNRGLRKWLRGMMNSLLPDGLAKRLLMNKGMLFDYRGRPISGRGAMGLKLAQHPATAALLQRHLEDTAGLATGQAAMKAQRSDKGAVKIKPENADEFEALADELISDFKVDEQGNVVRVEGIAVAEDPDVIKARQEEAPKVSEALKKQGIETQQVKDGESLFSAIADPSKDTVDVIMRTLRESGVFNSVQLRNLERILDILRNDFGRGLFMVYQKVYLTKRKAGLWWKRVPKSGLSVEWKKYIPYDVVLSNKGNILVYTMDAAQLARNIERLAQTPDGKSLYPGGVSDVWADVRQQMENRRRGIENEEVFTNSKMNFLNAVFGDVGTGQKELNPSIEKFKKLVRPVVRSPRLDRINKMSDLDGPVLPFQWDLIVQRRLPEPVSARSGVERTVWRGYPKSPKPKEGIVRKRGVYSGEAHGVGTYYGLTEADAQRFSQEGTVAAYGVTLQNPLVLLSDQDVQNARDEAAKMTGRPITTFYANPLDGVEAFYFTEAMREKGHDGVIIDYKEAAGGRQLVVFPKPESPRSVVSHGPDTKVTEASNATVIGPAAVEIRALPEPPSSPEFRAWWNQDESQSPVFYDNGKPRVWYHYSDSPWKDGVPVTDKAWRGGLFVASDPASAERAANATYMEIENPVDRSGAPKRIYPLMLRPGRTVGFDPPPILQDAVDALRGKRMANVEVERAEYQRKERLARALARNYSNRSPNEFYGRTDLPAEKVIEYYNRAEELETLLPRTKAAAEWEAIKPKLYQLAKARLRKRGVEGRLLKHAAHAAANMAWDFIGDTTEGGDYVLTVAVPERMRKAGPTPEGVSKVSMGWEQFEDYNMPRKSEFPKVLRELGYDYVQIADEAKGTMVVLRPGLVKSATGNTGRFDPASADIRYLPEPVSHATPHRVGRFSTERIGTGEGNQAWGWGLYFGSEAVSGKGGHYDQQFSNALRYDGKTINWGDDARLDPFVTAAELVESYRGDPDAKLRAAEDAEGFENAAEIRAAIQEIDPAKIERGSMIYTVRLRPEADEFLDWDKPLSEQSEKVREAITKYWEEARIQGSPEGLTGEGAYRSIQATVLTAPYAETTQAAEAASRDLKAIGIKGIRYLDGMSRGKGEGSYNYVIFDEADIEILAENDQPAPQLVREVEELEAATARPRPRNKEAAFIEDWIERKAREEGWADIDDAITEGEIEPVPNPEKRDEAFAKRVNAGLNRSADRTTLPLTEFFKEELVEMGVEAVEPGETAMDAVRTGERLGYEAKDIAFYLARNYGGHYYDIDQILRRERVQLGSESDTVTITELNAYGNEVERTLSREDAIRELTEKRAALEEIKKWLAGKTQ